MRESLYIPGWMQHEVTCGRDVAVQQYSSHWGKHTSSELGWFTLTKLHSSCECPHEVSRDVSPECERQRQQLKVVRRFWKEPVLTLSQARRVRYWTARAARAAEPHLCQQEQQYQQWFRDLCDTFLRWTYHEVNRNTSPLWVAKGERAERRFCATLKSSHKVSGCCQCEFPKVELEFGHQFKFEHRQSSLPTLYQSPQDQCHSRFQQHPQSPLFNQMVIFAVKKVIHSLQNFTDWVDQVQNN